MSRMFARFDRLQKRRVFKLAATIFVLAVGVLVYTSMLVSANAPNAEAKLLVSVSGIADQLVEEAYAAEPPPSDQDIGEILVLRAQRMGLEEMSQEQAVRAVERARERRESPGGLGWLESGPIGALSQLVRNTTLSMTTTAGATTVAIGIGLICLVPLSAIWLGIGMTFFGLLVCGWGLAWPLMLIEETAGLGRLLMGIVPLVLMFLTLLQAMRAVLSPSNAMTAVAKNVLNEAVRMKIGVVFIVLMLLLMAVVPLVQVEDQPLRYRVQQWMQYGLGFSYIILMLLTVFLSVSTLAFEQRDKVIWQTMTKPVPAWQYLLGKWVGVMALNLVLLSVAAGGVYLFTEYLRFQPAQGESEYHVDLRGNPTRGMNAREPSTDRRLLEEQVLVARIAAEPDPFMITPETLEHRVQMEMDRLQDPTDSERAEIRRAIQQEWDTLLQTRVDDLVEEWRAANPGAGQIPDQLVQTFREEVIRELNTIARAIPPGGRAAFVFDLSEVSARISTQRDRMQEEIDREVNDRVAEGTASEENREQIALEILTERIENGDIPDLPTLTLRYRVQAGANDPTAIYRFYVFINGLPYPEPAGQQMQHISAALNQFQTLTVPAYFVPRSGIVELGFLSDPRNERVAVFQPGDLQILFPTGGYELNFLRVVVVLWLKLGFIAAIGVLTGSFLAFPVACLVTFVVMFMAESSGFLRESLEHYNVDDSDGGISLFRVAARAISLPVSWVFSVYSDLRPTERLVDGRLLSWGSVGRGMGMLGAWICATLLVAWAIFRRKELAIYSGN